jgi:hypothetical protein
MKFRMFDSRTVGSPLRYEKCLLNWGNATEHKQMMHISAQLTVMQKDVAFSDVTAWLLDHAS